MESKFKEIYYSQDGLFKGLVAIDKLSEATGSTKEAAKDWLEKQVFYQIYLPPPKHIVRKSFNVSVPNEVHQANLLYLLHDKFKRKTYKYALTVIDIASRYKDAEALTTKNSEEVAAAFQKIYSRKLKYPKILQVDSGTEFKADLTKLMTKHSTNIRRGETNNHTQQSLVERFNRTLAEKIFGVQYAKEILLAARNDTERVTTWVEGLSLHISYLNNSVTRLIGMKPNQAIELDNVQQPEISSHQEILDLKPDQKVRYLYQPGESEKSTVKRATDPNWSLTTHDIARVLNDGNGPVLYYLHDSPKRTFYREQLLVVPEDSEIPPDNILQVP